jgi:hypothetical protein
MIVTGTPPDQRDGGPLTDASFADITPVPVINMDWGYGKLSVEFESDLSLETQVAVKRRIDSRNANEEQIRAQAYQAFINNRQFLAIAGTPTNAQVLAQVRALTRQANGGFRVMLSELDGTD